MIVKNSEFTNGFKNHIKGVNSIVRLSKVNIHDSTDRNAGHGFYCFRCGYVSIEDSIFENLVSQNGNGGAVVI